MSRLYAPTYVIYIYNINSNSKNSNNSSNNNKSKNRNIMSQSESLQKETLNSMYIMSKALADAKVEMRDLVAGSCSEFRVHGYPEP